MNDYTRGYFAVQLPMDADAEQVQRAIERISRAFGLTATDSAPAADAQITPQEIVNAGRPCFQFYVAPVVGREDNDGDVWSHYRANPPGCF